MFTPRRTRRHALVHIAQGGGDPPLPTPRAKHGCQPSLRQRRKTPPATGGAVACSLSHPLSQSSGKAPRVGGGLVGCLGVSRSGLQYRNPLSKLNLSLKIITLKDALEEKGGETSLR